MKKKLLAQPPIEVSTNRRESLLTTVTLNDELPDALEFGFLLNRCFFYATQHWIACAAESHDLAAKAWLDLRLQSQNLSAAPLAANAISRTVQASEDEFAKTQGLPWHRESRVNLLSDLHQLPDDEYYEAAEDHLFAAYVSPLRIWKESLLKSIAEFLSSTQLRAVLLGDGLGSYLLTDRVWKGMYLAEAPKIEPPAREANNQRAPRIGPELFAKGLRPPLDEIFWVRESLPSTIVNAWRLRLDDRAMTMLRQRFGELGLSWEWAQSILFNPDYEDSKPQEQSLSKFLTEESLTRFIQAVRAGTQASVSLGDANYLGIIIKDFTVFYRVQEASLGRSLKLKKLAEAFVKAGEVGLSRRDLEGLQRPGTNPNNVDQENGNLNRKLAKIGLTVDSDRASGKEGRFVLRPMMVHATN